MANGFVPRTFAEFAFFFNKRRLKAFGAGHKWITKPAFRAQEAFVPGIKHRTNPDYLIIFNVKGYIAAGSAIRADGINLFWIFLRAFFWPHSAVSAPEGHTETHCPQNSQSRSSSNAGHIFDLKPRYAKSIAPTPCTSSHIFTHLPQSMHFPISRKERVAIYFFIFLRSPPNILPLAS